MPPGVVFRMLKLLCECKPTTPIPPLDGTRNRLLDASLSKSSQAHDQLEIAELARNITVTLMPRFPRPAESLRSTWIARRGPAKCLRNSHIWQSAAQCARDWNVADLEKVALRELQLARATESDWSKIQTPLSLPKELPFEAARDWGGAIRHFLNTDAPSGDYETNKRNATESVSKPSSSISSARDASGHTACLSRKSVQSTSAFGRNSSARSPLGWDCKECF
jgi:hypothetical protein